MSGNPFSQAFSPAFGAGTIGFFIPFVLIPIGDPTQGLVVTNSDTTIYAPPLQKLQVGGSGDVSVIFIGDTTPVTLSAVRAGTVLDICVKQVMSTNTTATLITGLY